MKIAGRRKAGKRERRKLIKKNVTEQQHFRINIALHEKEKKR